MILSGNLGLVIKDKIAQAIFYKNILKSSSKHFLIKKLCDHVTSINKHDLIGYLQTIRIEKQTESINFIGSSLGIGVFNNS